MGVIPRRRQFALRARGAWRHRDDGRGYRWCGGHDQRGLVGSLQGDDFGPGDRRGRHGGWHRHRPVGNGLIDGGLLLLRHDRLDGGLCGVGSRRNDQHTQLGHLDPPLAPGEAEARKPGPLATEGQAQQQRVNQQGQQHRHGQPAALRAPGMDGPPRRVPGAPSTARVSRRRKHPGSVLEPHPVHCPRRESPSLRLPGAQARLAAFLGAVTRAC